MAYMPTLNDINQIDSSPSYIPTLDDINQLDQQSSVNPTQNQPSTFQKIASYLPHPSLPIGLNIASGIIGSVFPSNERGIVNALPEIATGQDYGLPQQLASGIGNTVPSLVTGGNSLLGQAAAGGALGAAQAAPGDRMKSAASNALSTIALGKIAPAIGTLIRPISSKAIVSGIQNAHDALQKSAEDAFTNVSSQVNARGIDQVPIDDNIFQQIKENKYLPNTPSNNALLEQARTGNYNSLRDLQSDLWTRGTKSLSSDAIADQNAGEEILALRDQINQSIQNHLISTGNEDLSDTLNGARNDWNILKQTYYNQYLPRAIPKMVNPDIREVPDNIFSVMSKKSIPMQALRDLNPGLQQDVNAFNARQSAKSGLKTAGWTAAGLYGLYQLLKQSDEGKSPLEHFIP